MSKLLEAAKAVVAEFYHEEWYESHKAKLLRTLHDAIAEAESVQSDNEPKCIEHDGRLIAKPYPDLYDEGCQ